LKAIDFFHKISNFLFSRANREFLIFLFFFAVAGIFWLLTTLNETYEQEIRIPVKYVNVPKTAVLTSAETDTIRVTVMDKGIVLLTYLYGDAMPEIEIDFNSHVHKNNTGEVTGAELSKRVSSHLAASSKLVSIKPDRLTFYYNFGERKRVPVKWRGTVTPDDLYFIADVKYNPDTITIYAPREKLDSINVIYTDVLNYTNFRDTLQVTTRLQRIAGVKMIPEIIDLMFMTDVLTEESINDIPVVGINMPPGKVLRLFPAKVSVKFVAGVKTYQQLSPSDFVVVADYNEIKASHAPKCNVYLQQTPPGISQATLNLTQLDYLIEDQPEQAKPSE
jgi:hypothetical protein